jgi:hypothetical protein
VKRFRYGISTPDLLLLSCLARFVELLVPHDFFPVASSTRLFERLTTPRSLGSYNKLRLGRRYPTEAVPLWYFHARPFVIELPRSIRRITGATRLFSRCIIDQTVRTIDDATDPGELSQTQTRPVVPYGRRSDKKLPSNSSEKCTIFII